MGCAQLSESMLRCVQAIIEAEGWYAAYLKMRTYQYDCYSMTTFTGRILNYSRGGGGLFKLVGTDFT